ncbi:MAG: biosynthetic arginine decarboxylase [Planctomycetota bacterium]
MSRDWSLEEAADLYKVANWGKGYVSIDEAGEVRIHPNKDPAESISLVDIAKRVSDRGYELPLLVRFTDVLRHRVEEMSAAFEAAKTEYGYRGDYVGVYPIKTNQQRQVVEEFLDSGPAARIGLECGSKPELLAVLALTSRRETTIICNGFKDAAYIEMVTLTQKLGKNILPVVEKPSELDLILEQAERHGVKPRFGIRVKLASKGSGRWRMTGGDRSKFGLTVSELLECCDRLKKLGLEDSFKLLHFHLGSQITNIHAVKNAISEAARIYVELKPEFPSVDTLDVGGGLGVDYDGSQTNFESSMNYTLAEYARDIVFRLKAVCDDADVKHPTILTESGRATVAYHSVLLADTLGSSSTHKHRHFTTEVPEDSSPSLRDLLEIGSEVTSKNVIESYHDAVQVYEELLHSFKLGFLSLRDRAVGERLYYRAAQRILKIVRSLDYVPEELEGLEDQLADIYFCNFSIFQSLPDSWAIDQLFPIMPIHRLNEKPTQRAVLADITCDSDGKINRFIDLRDVNKTLPLHQLDGDPYVLGFFLVGAYQEILGDLHNLFGDTHSVHVSATDGEFDIVQVVEGDRVEEVLSYVQYSAAELAASLRADAERAVRDGRFPEDDAARFLEYYEQSLKSYTYLGAPPRAEETDPQEDVKAPSRLAPRERTRRPLEQGPLEPGPLN